MINDQTPKPNQSISKSSIIYIALIIILVIVAAGLGYQYYKTQNELTKLQVNFEKQILNNKALDFTAFFIKSVLQAEGEVDFESRLKLEGMVRNLDDKEILATWNRFVNAPDDNIAQKEVKALLYMLVEKVRN